MIGHKPVRPGESYRLLVTFLRVRKGGVPSVIRVDGREYVLKEKREKK